jgi:hypothetical protein
MVANLLFGYLDKLILLMHWVKLASYPMGLYNNKLFSKSLGEEVNLLIGIVYNTDFAVYWAKLED